jgi:hypothetical protein
MHGEHKHGEHATLIWINAPFPVPMLIKKQHTYDEKMWRYFESEGAATVMSAEDKNFKMGLDRVNALFKWWGVSDTNTNDKINNQMKRLHALISDLQKAHSEAYSRQLEALFTVSERVAGSAQEFVRCRQPEHVISVGSNVLATILEGASLQAKSWLDLTQKIQDCCAEMARETTVENSSPTDTSIDATRPVKASDHTIQAIKAEGDTPRPINARAAAQRSVKTATKPGI